MKKNRVSILLFLAVFSIMFFVPKITAEASSYWVDTKGISAGQTIKISVYKGEKKLSNKNYSLQWSVSDPYKVLSVKSGKNAGTASIYCRKYCLSIPKKGDDVTGKIQCVVKSKKGKTLATPKGEIYASPNRKYQYINILNTKNRTITITPPAGKSIAKPYDLNIKSFKGTTVKNISGKYVFNIKTNGSYTDKSGFLEEMGIQFTTDDSTYNYAIQVVRDKWAMLDTTGNKDEMNAVKSRLDDVLTTMYFNNRGPYKATPKTMKKGNYLTIACGAKKGTGFQIVSGGKLLKTLSKKKQYVSGGYDTEWTYNTKGGNSAWSTAYVTAGVYKTVKKGTVKIKVTYADKTTKTVSIKIK